MLQDLIDAYLSGDDEMVRFAKKQDAHIAEKLLNALNGRKPFRVFKDKLNMLGIEKQWYNHEQDYAR